MNGVGFEKSGATDIVDGMCWRVNSIMSALPSFARSTRRRLVHETFFLVAVVVIALFACKKKGQFIGSCDRRSPDKNQSVCQDAVDDFILNNCTSPHYETRATGTKSEKLCERTGAIAGCKDSSSTDWFFPSKTIRKVEHVAYVCTGTVIGIDGAPLSGVSPAKTASPEELEAESAVPRYKSQVEAKLTVIEKIAKKLPPPSAKARAPASDLGHHLYAHEEDLATTLGKPPRVDYRDPDSQTLAACARIVRNGDVTGVTNPSATLSECATAEHLIVIRMRSLTEPKQVEGLNQYESGRASGDVLVFELSGGKLVGSAPYSATSSRDLKTEWKTFAADLKKDFGAQLGAARGAAVKTATSKP